MAKQIFNQCDAATIDTLIAGVKKASSSLVSKIQFAAVQCIGHAFEHGDVRPATKLLDAVGKGIRRQALVAFFEKNGPFVFSEGSFKFYKNEQLNFQADKLLATCWVDSKPEPKLVSELDIDDQVSKMFARIEKAIAADPSSVKNLELYTALQLTVAKFHAGEMDATLPKLHAA